MLAKIQTMQKGVGLRMTRRAAFSRNDATRQLVSRATHLHRAEAVARIKLLSIASPQRPTTTAVALCCNEQKRNLRQRRCNEREQDKTTRLAVFPFLFFYLFKILDSSVKITRIKKIKEMLAVTETSLMKN